MDFDKSILDEFITEAKEHLETVEDDLLALEKNVGSSDFADTVNKVFRAVHTVKGTAGFLGLKNMAEVAHAAETILSMLRSGDARPGPVLVDALLSAVDAIRAMLDDAENSNNYDISKTMARMETLLSVKQPQEAEENAGAPPAAPDTKPQAGLDALKGFNISKFELKHLLDSCDYFYVLKYDLAGYSASRNKSPVGLVKELQELGEIVSARLHSPAGDIKAGLPAGELHYDVLFASILDADAMGKSTGLSPDRIYPIQKSWLAVDTEGVGGEPAGINTDEGMKVREETVAEEDIGNVIIENSTSGSKEINDAAKAAVSEADGGAKEKAEGIELPERRRDDSKKDTIRIKLGILNDLMQLAGELVLVRNQQLLSVDKSDPQSRANIQRLNIVTSELQETIMATRMQPIGNLFGKFPRVVRDLGKKLGKQIEVEITGSEVELDNTILEALSDPLTHLVRNCCDHGIEAPADRLRAGKAETGAMVLRAYHESGQINIEITDDGKGIDPVIIKRKILEKKLKTEAELAVMSEKDITALILLPGFSTAEKLSDVSGRGVGMDVVKTSIEGLGGTLDIESQVGKGTTIYMRLPLTLAIIPCLIVMVGDFRYAIPQVNLEELVCLYDEDVKNKIESAGGREVYRLRNHLLPMVRLEEIFKRNDRFSDRTNAEITESYRKEQDARYLDYLNKKAASGGDALRFSQSLNFAVLKVGANNFGLIVDRVVGTEEIVVKPMHPSLKSLGIYAGATVMGDGKVALILDAMGIARNAGISFDGRAAAVKTAISQYTDMQRVLLFNSGPQEQFAIALPLIQRIESVPVSRMEKIGGKEYITIDGVSTLVVRLDGHLNVTPCAEKDEMYLILPKHAKHPFGILASSLVDTAETSIDLNTDSYREDGLLGTAIIKDKMTLFLDIHSLIEKAEPSWFAGRKNQGTGANGNRILLVEDSSFYRQLVKKYLEADGYKVITAENGQEGLSRIGESRFDLVISDIQMPVMDGLAFLKNLRGGQCQQGVPAIALTSMNSEADKAKANEVGFNRYELKINKDRLLTTVSELLGAYETDN